MKLLRPAVLCLAFLAAAPTSAQEAKPRFLPPDALDLAAILPPPPAADSATTKAELTEVRRIQAAATDAEKAQAIADLKETVFLFTTVLGPDFVADKLPVATPFFLAAGKAEGEFVNPVKKLYNRPRPPVADPAIVPCEALTGSASYPSGHATFSYIEAVVLSEMIPEKRDALFARAAEFAQHRIICGMHYASDLDAGRISGAVIAAALLADPTFRAEFGPAKAEVRKVLGLPPQ